MCKQCTGERIHCSQDATSSAIHQTQEIRFWWSQDGIPQAYLDQIKAYIDHRRSQNLGVTIHLIRINARKIDPTIFDNIPTSVFNHRMYRMMRKWEISYRRKTTKVPQNTRHSEDIKTRFIRYVKFRMNLIGVDFDDVYNVDQTNLPFSIEGVYTWAQQNSESVALKGSKTDGRATVMSGTNATGTQKLPPFLIFKGTMNGRIAREIRQKVGYPAGDESNEMKVEKSRL
jgi:hypothetical protein